MEISAELLTECHFGMFFGEASSFHLNPGEWPDVLTISKTIGNGQPFTLFRVNSRGDHIYEQTFGNLTVTILND